MQTHCDRYTYIAQNHRAKSQFITSHEKSKLIVHRTDSIKKYANILCQINVHRTKIIAQ